MVEITKLKAGRCVEITRRRDGNQESMYLLLTKAEGKNIIGVDLCTLASLSTSIDDSPNGQLSGIWEVAEVLSRERVQTIVENRTLVLDEVARKALQDAIRYRVEIQKLFNT